jgi:predicted peptidase
LQQELRFHGRATKRIELRSLLHLPNDYRPVGGPRQPLLLFLPGAGERGADFALVAKHGPPKLYEWFPGHRRRWPKTADLGTLA